MRLTFHSPYNWVDLIRFLQARTIPGVEEISPDGYKRSVHIHEEIGLLEVSPKMDEGHLELSITPNLSPNLMAIVERLRWMFDLAADTISIAMHFQDDKVLAPIFEKHPGLRLPGAWEPFELSIRAILGQQISVQAANTLCGRLVQRFGEEISLDAEARISHLFPTPEKLMKADVAKIGMPAKRAQTIQAFAQAVRS